MTGSLREREPISRIDLVLKEYHGIFAIRSVRHVAPIEGVIFP